jgi:hypothetical protein
MQEKDILLEGKAKPNKKFNINKSNINNENNKQQEPSSLKEPPKGD